MSREQAARVEGVPAAAARRRAALCRRDTTMRRRAAAALLLLASRAAADITVGIPAARSVKMTAMPQMVALFPELRLDRRKGHQVLHVSDSAPPPRAGTLDAFAQ